MEEVEWSIQSMNDGSSKRETKHRCPQCSKSCIEAYEVPPRKGGPIKPKITKEELDALKSLREMGSQLLNQLINIETKFENGEIDAEQAGEFNEAIVKQVKAVLDDIQRRERIRWAKNHGFPPHKYKTSKEILKSGNISLSGWKGDGFRGVPDW
jgi:hypothetical protein